MAHTFQNGETSVEKQIIHVEAIQKSTSVCEKDLLISAITTYLQSNGIKDLKKTSEIADDLVRNNIESWKICGETTESQETEFEIHIFKLESSEPQVEDLDDSDEQIPAATQWLLPSHEFHGLWETLIYDSDVKSKLLNFVYTTMIFSDVEVDSKIINWNRIILLHGPPGTGKTSLCKALAHKAAIRLSHRYSYAQLIEINSHSLFSKWFSESGKLVMKMFSRIYEMTEDPQALICVLIDEVESLARSRHSVNTGNEPSDSVRVVNALLTQIDTLKRLPNVLILTTSNISGTIDLAFVDRADIKQYIGLPSARAIYNIYLTCIQEMIRTGLVQTTENISADVPVEDDCAGKSHWSCHLWKIAKKSEGLSGRTLRKIPFLAHAYHIQSPKCSLELYLRAMDSAVDKQFEERELLG